METERAYLVEFEGPMNNEARAALEEAGVSLLGASGGGSFPDDYEVFVLVPQEALEDPNHHFATLYASNETAAGRAVEDALEDRMPCTVQGVRSI